MEDVVIILETFYGDPNRVAMAQRKLNKITQNSKNFPTYFAEFHCYAKETGWNEFALINQLVESLNPKLKTALVGIKLLKTIADYTNVINSLYNDILCLVLKHMFWYSAHQPHKTHKDSDTIDINTGTLKYTLLKSAKQEQHIK